MLTDEQRSQGWVEHDGKGCPVEPDGEVDYILRSGEQFRRKAGKLIWQYGTFINEIHEPMPSLCEIVAYKPEADSHE